MKNAEQTAKARLPRRNAAPSLTVGQTRSYPSSLRGPVTRARSRRWRSRRAVGLLLLVVDQFGDLDERDGRTHPIESGDAFDEFLAEEPSRGLFGVPEVNVGCPMVLLIDSKSLLAKVRQTLETPTRLVRYPLDAAAIEVVGVLELGSRDDLESSMQSNARRPSGRGTARTGVRDGHRTSGPACGGRETHRGALGKQRRGGHLDQAAGRPVEVEGDEEENADERGGE